MAMMALCVYWWSLPAACWALFDFLRGRKTRADDGGQELYNVYTNECANAISALIIANIVTSIGHVWGVRMRLGDNSVFDMLTNIFIKYSKRCLPI